MMNVIIAVFQILLLGTIGFFMAYLAFLSLLASKGRNADSAEADSKRRFAIVVPAYNEENSLPGTLKNLFAVDYPGRKFDIVVIADNCTDNTAEVAEAEGAQVMVRNNPEKRGKGYALRWCFDRLVENHDTNQYDAAIVLDADCIVSKNLLKIINQQMANGAEVVQGYLTVESKPAWTSEVVRIGFTLYDYVRPLGRKAIGCPAGLRGNGMCFSMDVLKQIPWDAYSLTEDLEYSIKLLLNDIDIVFAPETVGFTVIPENAENAESQRERWEIGRYPILKKYFGKLFTKAVKKRSFKVFDALVDLVTPPLVNMMTLAFGMAAVSLLFWFIGLQSTLLWFWLWLVVVGLGIFHALLGLYAAGADRSTYQSLLYVPRYAVWKLYVYAKLLFNGRTTEWVRTSRESN